MKGLRALIVLLIPAAGLCQSLGYMDADNPSQAVGMMKSTMQVAESGVRRLAPAHAARLRIPRPRAVTGPDSDS